MTYTCVIHKNFGSGLWCACKHYLDGTVGEDYAFGASPNVVNYKLEEDGEEQECIVYDD